MNKIRFGGDFTMKRLRSVLFVYEDGTQDEIIDPRAALLFQSRCNSNGILSGMEDYVISDKAEDNAESKK